ncbi:hypothetical protein CAC42_3249 [Sphaceloma murrayae]|uniref:Uncharacterized protein n=1 Tax=Sphaceloma murrayae TaxID=2082308 RepID=A0A2K1QFD8_9PEZI|nr:hypothetical protein CAC42_3249 [Sphaceloma murrayae]
MSHDILNLVNQHYDRFNSVHDALRNHKLCDFTNDFPSSNCPALPTAQVIDRPATVPDEHSAIQSASPGVTLVIPSAGRSSRFPGHKPKWLLTLPDGNLMVVGALSALDLSVVSRLVVGVLREHVQKYCHGDPHAILAAFDRGHEKLRRIPLSLVVIENETRDQVQTIELILQCGAVSGPVFFKDCDNSFACTVSPVNGVATFRITHNLENLNVPGGKAYVKIGKGNRLTSILEKQIMSDTFCIGGYSFASADDMLTYVNKARCYQSITKNGDNELALSDIIWLKMIDSCLLSSKPASQEPFVAISATRYEDWGTIQAFKEYQKTFRTLFIDIDGTLVKNAGQYFGNIWGSQLPLPNNIDLLKRMYETGRVQIILTTSRTERFREITERQMRAVGMPYDQIVFGLLHATRVIINDYAKTNPYPSSAAINVQRDADDLASYLR